MNYKKEDKEYIEKSGRYAYYDFTEKGVERIVGTNVENVSSYDWKRLIQMIYPTNMIGSGLFQPILIFRISIYEKYLSKVNRNVEGFVINYKNMITKYVRMKNGKLQEHFDRGE